MYKPSSLVLFLPEYLLLTFQMEIKSNPSVSDEDWGLVRHCISFLDRDRYMKVLFKKMPLTLKAQIIFGTLFDGELSKRVMMGEVNRGGLEVLNEVLISTSQPEIQFAMRTVLEAVRMRLILS